MRLNIDVTDGKSSDSFFVAHFRHIPKRHPHDRGFTYCRLHVGTCENDDRATCAAQAPGPSVGRAVCNPHDQFDKATGRKVALADAMQRLGLCRETRTHLWASYRTQTRRM